MEKEKMIYTEVYMTLTRLNPNYINKIPDDLKEEILNKADTRYPFVVNELLSESKAMIAIIIDRYIKKI